MANKVELRISWFAHTWFSPECLLEEMSDPSRWILDGHRWWPFDEREKGLLGKLQIASQSKTPSVLPISRSRVSNLVLPKAHLAKTLQFIPQEKLCPASCHVTQKGGAQWGRLSLTPSADCILAVYANWQSLIRRLLIWSPSIRWFFQTSGFDAWRHLVAFRVGKALMTVWSVSYGYRNTRIGWNCQDPSGWLWWWISLPMDGSIWNLWLV